MAYRKRTTMSKRMAAARAAKARKREAGPAPDYPPILPELRRKIIVIDYDFGEVRHEIDLYRSGRIDCYRAVADGVEWKRRIGWSSVLAALRKSLPRLMAMRD